MSRFYLHLFECGTVFEDEEGIELDDLAEAKQVASKGALDIMATEVKEGRLCLSCHIEIADGRRKVLDTVRFKDLLAISGL